jgi:hypothetical protein
MTRGAVVIGVNATRGLPGLNAAVSGADKVAAWLRAEGFDVKLLTDATSRVRSADVFAAISEFVERGTLSQLVIFFAGHGCILNYSEHWLLSDAPANPNEAINLYESVVLARECGIPNVVFISDACRSLPNSLAMARIKGNIVFPNAGATAAVRGDVDQFLATLAGSPAYEVPADVSVPNYRGIYTDAFLHAFISPTAEMVKTVNGEQVVPNRALKAFLDLEVRRRAAQVSIRLNQVPDALVMSGDATYIGRAPPSVSSSFTSGSRVSSIADVAADQLMRAGAGALATTPSTSTLGPQSGPPIVLPMPEVIGDAARAKFIGSRNWILKGTKDPVHFETRTGISVTGARVAFAASNPLIDSEVLRAGDALDSPGLVRVTADRHLAASVVLGFDNGLGTVIAALREYVAAVVVGDRGVINVSYVPSTNSPRWDSYASQRQRLDELHGAVAAAAQFGVLRIEGDRNTRTERARAFAGRIRLLKGIDPTLGVYAAYAYDQADLLEEVRSVQDIMRSDLGIDIFDVALLAGRLSTPIPASALRLSFPFCPMLSQGWGLLRVRDVSVPDVVRRARDYLVPSLWTTFELNGTDLLSNAVRSGALI